MHALPEKARSLSFANNGCPEGFREKVDILYLWEEKNKAIFFSNIKVFSFKPQTTNKSVQDCLDSLMECHLDGHSFEAILLLTAPVCDKLGESTETKHGGLIVYL